MDLSAESLGHVTMDEYIPSGAATSLLKNKTTTIPALKYTSSGFHRRRRYRSEHLADHTEAVTTNRRHTNSDSAVDNHRETDMCFTGSGVQPVEIKGVAMLCFDGEGSWFQGSIASEDDTQYAIYGTKTRRTSQTNTGCDCPSSEEDYLGQEGVPVTFDIRVVDCDVGEEYSLKRVHGRNGEVCTFTCPCVTFTTENVYRGQKADMMAQHCLGHKLQGKRSQVYRGPIRLLCVPIRRNTHWVM
ncbi:hypothetical protein Pmani_009065 [Petrolisthes manimaculis]|uniref:Uncharacterized protein n=1 Tax=Petrolisthes manimaculis TaxID=1843537 RepID=A0AAE1UDA4_9EUCA|nr:hypothetical protein Pmani_009065 [Petrolisthes manimaculis]